MNRYKLPILAFLCFLMTFSQPQNISADWTSDLTPPDCPITFDRISPQRTGPVIKITVGASDVNTGNSGILSATLSQLFDGNTTSLNLNGNYEYSWNTNNIATGSYSYNATATDNGGNSKTCTNNFTLNPPYDSWIQTTNGDIHSNTSINTPQGPP